MFCITCQTCLQADILDVNQIFKDLAMMIHDQGDMIGKCVWIIRSFFSSSVAHSACVVQLF